jgi:ABC-2 type transport system ATP-binding protein
MSSLLQVSGLSKRYGARQAVDGVSFAVGRGQTVGLIGPYGAGKSTTVGVDPQSRTAIFETLERLQAMGCALIYTSHYMEEVERLAERIVIIDHGKLLAVDTPAGLFRKRPAHAALRLDFDQPPAAALLAEIRVQGGVTEVRAMDGRIDIALAESAAALPLLGWLEARGARPQHFATARTSLEDLFLNLTGRTLRD